MALTRILPVLLAVAALGLAPGCAAITAIGTAAAPLDAYMLTPAAAETPRGSTARHIVVELPTSSGAIDTDRILVKPSPIQVMYLPGARWIDPAPNLVQSLLVESLQTTGAFRHVGRTTVGPFPDYTLLTEIVDFQAEATGDEFVPYQTRVTFAVSLVREEDREVIATRRFTATEPVEAIETVDVVGAFDRATDAVLRDVVDWLLARFGIRAS